jgi:ABC-type Fe3+-hydroxamate transport system substrate-binding protein
VGALSGSASASPGGAEAKPRQEGVSAPEAEVDDLGHPLGRTGPPQRVVSLVPSLTESVALSAPRLLVGATDYCTHPADLDVARVGGSKYPDLDRVKALRPDLVLANAEENELSDVDDLRAAGLAVWVTGPTTLAAAFTSLRRMLAACGVSPAPPWLDEARRAWSSAYDGSPPTRTAVVPIWRRPWMVLGAGTFAGDVLRRLGVANAYGTSGERYPRTTVEEMRATGADLIVLPDEPYAFTRTDGPEEFEGLDVALVSGRHLTWYGPSLREARDLLERQLAAAAPAGSLSR